MRFNIEKISASDSVDRWAVRSHDNDITWVDRTDACELRDLLLREFPVDDDRAVHAEGWKQFHNRERRERIATAVLAGFYANSSKDYEDMNYREFAEQSLMQADALIAALDKEQ